MYKRGSSVKQNENFSFQEHVTEASLISFAGALKGKRGKSRCLFSFVQPEKDLTPPGFRVLTRESEPQVFSVLQPLHDSVDGHPAVASFGRWAASRPFQTMRRRADVSILFPLF